MGEKTAQAAREWFKPELRTKAYESSGDAYDDARYVTVKLEAKWNVDSAGDEYLTLVKQASESKWIHLRLLADFMQIGRIPRVWDKSKAVIPSDREARWGRANIRILDYYPFPADGNGAATVGAHKITSIKTKGLTTAELNTQLLTGPIPVHGPPPPPPPAPAAAAFRLHVVEDLSRNVISALGTTFGISPDFFRAHIVDYAWYNVRDRWREPQPLEVVREARNWFQIRFVTARYFASRDKPKTMEQEQQQQKYGGCFEAALEEAKEFNILRRPDDDQSRGWWDSDDMVVALTRAKATFWLKPKQADEETPVGRFLHSYSSSWPQTHRITRCSAPGPERVSRPTPMAWTPQLPPSTLDPRRPERGYIHVGHTHLRKATFFVRRLRLLGLAARGIPPLLP